MRTLSEITASAFANSEFRGFQSLSSGEEGGKTKEEEGEAGGGFINCVLKCNKYTFILVHIL